MNAKYLVMGVLTMIGLALTNCASGNDEPILDPEVDESFVEAPKCNGTVTAMVYSSDGSRYSSSYLEENIDRFTATRVDTKNSDFTLVSYHGRNRENIGMVQLINPQTNEVLSELVLLDARVNFAQYRNSAKGDVVYVGVDRDGSQGLLCGILPVPVRNKKFDIGNDAATQLTPYKVTGLSVNCIKQHNGDTNKIGNDVMAVAAGGNDGLGDAGAAGFTKFRINSNDPTKLMVLREVTAANYRGYWFSFGYRNGAPLAYTYRTVDNGDLVFKVGVISFDNGVDMFSNNVNDKFITDYPVAEAEVWRQEGNTVNLGRYNVIAIKKEPLANKFVIVATGTKEGGIRAYRYDQNVAGGPKLTLVDVWHKACNCLGTEVIIDGNYYIFGACGDGVYKIALDFDLSDPNNKTMTMRPIEKRKTTVLTESNTLASTNYIQTSGDGAKAKIHVAGGYEGYYVLDFNDSQFVPCDKRTDFSLE